MNECLRGKRGVGSGTGWLLGNGGRGCTGSPTDGCGKTKDLLRLSMTTDEIISPE